MSDEEIKITYDGSFGMNLNCPSATLNLADDPPFDITLPQSERIGIGTAMPIYWMHFCNAKGETVGKVHKFPGRIEFEGDATACAELFRQMLEEAKND